MTSSQAHDLDTARAEPAGEWELEQREPVAAAAHTLVQLRMSPDHVTTSR